MEEQGQDVQGRKQRGKVLFPVPEIVFQVVALRLERGIAALLFHCYPNHHPLCYEETVPAKSIPDQQLWDLRRRGETQGDRG